VRYDALGEDQDGQLGTDAKVFMDKRLKLLESGAKVVKAPGAAGGPKKWEAKAESKGYSTAGDFVKDEENPNKRARY